MSDQQTEQTNINVNVNNNFENTKTMYFTRWQQEKVNNKVLKSAFCSPKKNHVFICIQLNPIQVNNASNYL